MGAEPGQPAQPMTLSRGEQAQAKAASR